ncbi:MAG: D-2-hydroxyacid dehydrogenase [Lachnospiraceae bacterium]|nr:D-2-hydroxyacid dehydrogenase [Lachnospiraceae bacterium]
MNIVVLEAASIGRDIDYESVSQFGHTVCYDVTPQELVSDRIKEADIVLCNKCLLNEEVLREAKNVKLICECATGYNNVDIAYCKERGIAVTNVKGYSTEVVAQHTFAMLLSLLEHLDYYTTYVEDGDYSSQNNFSHLAKPFHELSGMCYGIIGLGAIGRKVAEIATAFGAQVIYYSASGNTYDVPYEAVSFEELLTRSDVVSIHAPLNEKTNGLINKEAFEKMKKTAVLLNVGRGPIVVEKDLARALEDCEIMAAGLDVFEKEPLAIDSPLRNVRDRDRLFLTPHMAWGSVEARRRLVDDVCQSIQAFINGENRSRVV